MTISSTVSYSLLWTITNVLSVLMCFFGGTSYLAPNYWMSPADPRIPHGILKTSLASNDLDPVTSFFFRGEGAMKFSVAITGLLWSRFAIAAEGRDAATAAPAATTAWRRVQRFNAYLFLALLVPAIPV